MLEIKNISSGYGKKQVLYDVSLDLNKGEGVLLSGGNGSGKSTLLKCIYNIVPLWSGEIYFEGKRINGFKPFDLIRMGIVYIPQKDFCFDNLTIEENLQIAGTIYSKVVLNQRINKVYDLTGLDSLKKRMPFNLSGGEKKLLAFGMGLLHQPKLILFDEPLAGVDAKTSKLINDICQIELLERNVSSIFVEHKNELKISRFKILNLELGKL
jgi:ABC-type branched-subunit amino acid transport system ATPase component